VHRIFSYRPSSATAVICIALLVAVGGVAFASIPDSSGVVHACYQKKGGGLRVIGGGKCRKSEKSLAWSQQGRQGLQGVNGAQGIQGAQGAKGEKGQTGPAGPFPGTLPSGVTLRGSYAANVNATAGGQVVRVGVPFEFTLASKPTVHFLASGAKPTVECPGSVATPEAQAGHLCVYEDTGANTSSVEIYDPTTGLPGSSQMGWYVRVSATAAGDALSYGTWAVTSP
jgi:hypothetical protein